MESANRNRDSQRWIVGVFVGSLALACLWGSSLARGWHIEKSPTADADVPGDSALGDPARGRLLFLQCRSCHSVDDGGMNKVGPNLYGVIGNQAGMAKDFIYSQELLDAGVVWTRANLDAWLSSPSDFIPGNRMIYGGVADPQDRADIIAYLEEATTL